MQPIDDLRRLLDEADDRLLAAIQSRFELVARIGDLKREDPGISLRDAERERALIGRHAERAQAAGLDPVRVRRIFEEIIRDSVRRQENALARPLPGSKEEAIRIAFLGRPGSNSHLAAQSYVEGHPGGAVAVGYKTLRESLEAVEKGEVDATILPIENTVAGSINETYDLLARTRVPVVGEEVVAVEHALLTLTEVPLARIRRVISHPQALLQCSDFLAGLPYITTEVAHDTGAAAEKVRATEDITCAAIAGPEAARIYGLHVLKNEVSNRKENYTRFVVVADREVRHDPRVRFKTSLIVALNHEPGSLAVCLSAFKDFGVNLTKLESRPKPGAPWEYLFYIDFEGAVSEDAPRRALEAVRPRTTYLKILGSYPARTGAGSAPWAFAGVTVPVAVGPVPAVEVAAADGAETEAPRGPEKTRPYRLVGTEEARRSIVGVRGVQVGGGRFVVMAGPCAVESREQVDETARIVAEAGAAMLRGGVFKPRSSPYAFQGLGYEGLDLLCEAGRRYGLPVITEVLTPGDVERVAEKADCLQIGARNMQNFSLLREVGRVDRPVLLKRGLMSSIEELLLAAEYILSAGNRQVILCERGIRTFERATRNTLDLSAIPVLREETHLPVIVDPSHATGRRSLVAPMARAALAAGADGIIVEVHPHPEQALCDGEQALTAEGFARLMGELAALAAASGRTL